MYRFNEEELNELEKIKKRHFNAKISKIIIITSIITIIAITCFYIYTLSGDLIYNKAVSTIISILMISPLFIVFTIFDSKYKIKNNKIITKAVENNLYEVIPCKISKLEINIDDTSIFSDKINIKVKITPIEKASEHIDTDYFYNIYSSKSDTELNNYLQENKYADLKMIVFNNELKLLMLI